MNQILLTNNDNNNRNDNKRNHNKDREYNRSNSGDMKKIITFFAIVILVFGVAIGGVYGYRVYKNNGQGKNSKGPEVVFKKTEDDEVTIIAKADAGISKIIYKWDDEEESIKEIGGNRTKHEELIEVPYGTSTLKVTIIDKLGEEKEFTEEFINSGSGIEESDKINVEVAVEKIDGIGTGRIIVKAEAELPIKSIIYDINGNEETEIELEEEQSTVIEQKIDIKDKLQRELNIITVKVTDIQENSNEDEIRMEGRLKPEFEVYKEGDRLYVIVRHDMGFEEIEFNINEIEIIYDEDSEVIDLSNQEQVFYFTLQEGENIVSVKARSKEGTEEEYIGRTKYNP